MSEFPQQYKDINSPRAQAKFNISDAFLASQPFPFSFSALQTHFHLKQIKKHVDVKTIMTAQNSSDLCNVGLCFLLLRFLLLQLQFIMPYHVHNSNASSPVPYRFSTFRLGFLLHETLARSKKCTFSCDLSIPLDDVELWLVDVGMQPWGTIAALE